MACVMYGCGQRCRAQPLLRPEISFFGVRYVFLCEHDAIFLFLKALQVLLVIIVSKIKIDDIITIYHTLEIHCIDMVNLLIMSCC